MIQAILLLVSPGTILAVVAVAALVFSRASHIARVIAAVAAVLLLSLRIHNFSVFHPSPYYIDLAIFRKAGLELMRGSSPYAPSQMKAPLNPPSAFPLFVGFAALSPEWAGRLWGLFNVVGGLLLVPLSWIALGGRRQQLGSTRALEIAVLAVVVGVSDAVVTQTNLGQLAVLASLALIGSIALRTSGWPFAAGLGLAVATIKVGTMLPFALLALERQKSDRRCLAGLVLGLAALTFSTTSPGELPERCGEMLRKVRQFSGPGQVNDLTFAGPENDAIIGIPHAAYRIGVVDEESREIIEAAVLTAIGGSMAWCIWRGILHGPPLYALIGLYAPIFLYHRVYDLIIMALPLTFVVDQASAPRRPGNAPCLGLSSAIAMTLAINLRVGGFKALCARWGTLSGPVRALILPSVTWLVLSAFAFLALSIAQRRRQEAE